VSTPVIRPATSADAAAIAAIYNHYVRTSTATFDTQEKSAEDRVAWLAEHDASHPVLVAENDGRIVAWGSLSRWGTRCAYEHSVEISVYVHPESTQAGVGPSVAEALIEIGRACGHHALISQTVSENEPSLKMTRRLGFAEVGTLRQVGRKFDRWLDVVLMELLLPEDPASADA
jgi:phosphinothricin acetyltransferase